MVKFILLFTIRIFLALIAPIVLFIPTLYATARNLERLPYPFDSIFGCREDGWNGTGCDPAHPRKHWKNVDGKTIQGWWPDYLGVIWDDLPFIKRWWYGYKWCAWRNVCWNLRLTRFATSIHYQDIHVYHSHVGVGEGRLREETHLWRNKRNGKKYFFKRRKIFGIWFEYGWEFYPQFFDKSHSWYERVRKEGYTFEVAPFKQRSIVSARPRRR